jgi:hypothetical protein
MHTDLVGNPPLTIAELQQVGMAAFGTNWQTELGRALGLSGDGDRIRKMISGKRPIPPGFRAELVTLLRVRGGAALALADALDLASKRPV